MLAVDDLNVSYGNISALRGVSLHVEAREIVAVIGPNGAGKSSLLNSIAGAVPIIGGTIQFEDNQIAGKPPEDLVRLGISLVPEGRHIFSGLSVWENIRIGAVARKDRTAISEDAERVLETFPVLRERLKQPAGKLSGGEQQMLAISRALLARPRLLLIDEPSLGLAPLVVDEVYRAVAGLREEGVTILLVEQSATRALQFADRIYVLNTGSIVMSGTSDELREATDFEDAYFGYGTGSHDTSSK